MIKGKFPKCIIKYSIESIVDHDSDRCYKISFRMTKKGKSNILVIGRAPKRCNENSVNKAMQRIVKYLNFKKNILGIVGKVTLINLFVICEYDRKTINNTFIQKGESFVTGNDEYYLEDNYSIKNDEIIKQEIQAADYIILAWGEPLKEIEILYNTRVEYVLKTIRQCNIENNCNKIIYTVGDLTKKGYPRHCMGWTTKDELIDYLKYND